MKKEEIIRLLELFRRGELGQEEAAEQFLDPGVESLGFATIDTDREGRTGIPEVIYSSGKTPAQVAEIAERMHKRGIPVLATRANPDVFEAVKEKLKVFSERTIALLERLFRVEVVGVGDHQDQGCRNSFEHGVEHDDVRDLVVSLEILVQLIPDCRHSHQDVVANLH